MIEKEHRNATTTYIQGKKRRRSRQTVENEEKEEDTISLVQRFWQGKGNEVIYVRSIVSYVIMEGDFSCFDPLIIIW